MSDAFSATAQPQGYVPPRMWRGWWLGWPKWFRTGFRTALGLFVLSFSATSIRAGTLEDETERLLAQLPGASQDEIEKILYRLREIGPEARAARDAVYEQFLTEASRFDAGDALTAMGTEAIPLIRRALRHKDPAIRSAMASCIPRLGPFADPLVPDLLPLLKDVEKFGDGYQPSYEAIKTLGELKLRPKDVVPPLRRLLYSVGDSKAIWASSALKEFGASASAALPHLAVASLFHPEASVRETSLRALVSIDERGDTALLMLTWALKDPGDYNSSVRWEALRELLNFGPRAAVAAPSLAELLKEEYSASMSPYIFTILGEAEYRPVNPLLKQELQKEPFPNQKDYQFSYFSTMTIPKFYESTLYRSGALWTLARMEDDNRPLIEELHKILIDEQWRITNRRGDKGAQLDDPRAIAAHGLGRLGEKAVWTLPTLKKLVNENPGSREPLIEEAAWAVARLDRDDRECLKVLKHVPFIQGNWRCLYNGESPESVVEILGDRIDEVLPEIVVSYSANGDNRFARDALIEIGPPALRMLVVQRFESVRKNGLRFDLVDTIPQLEDLGPRAAPAMDLLTGYLESENPRVRAAAAYHLGSIGLPAAKAVPQLTIALDDERVVVRACAAMSLGRIGLTKEAGQEKLQRLSKEDPYQTVRQAASNAVQAAQKQKSSQSPP